MKKFRSILVLAASLLLAGGLSACGETEQSAEVTPAFTVAEQAYLDYVHKLLPSTASDSDEFLVSHGWIGCQNFNEGNTVDDLVHRISNQAVQENIAPEKLATMVGAGVSKLCPQYVQKFQGIE